MASLPDSRDIRGAVLRELRRLSPWQQQAHTDDLAPMLTARLYLMGYGPDRQSLAACVREVLDERDLADD
jgi:hypothetical protein